MSLLAQLNSLRAQRKNVLDEAGKILTKAATEKRNLTAEETQEFEKRHADGDKMQSQIEAFEKQMAAESTLKNVDTRSAGREDTEIKTADQIKADDKAAYDAAYRNWLAKGENGLKPDQYKLLVEKRALSDVTGSAGQYTVPQDFVYQLDVALKAFGGMLEAATEMPTSDGRVMPYPTMNDTTASATILAENTAMDENVDPSFGQISFNAYMLKSDIVLMPIQLVQDSAFNLDGYLAEALGIRIGRGLNAYCTTGTGTGQPRGLLASTGGATLGVTAAATNAVTYNELLSLQHSVDPLYQNGASWMFSFDTLRLIRSLVDENKRPLFIAGGVSEGIQNAAPNTIMGKPYTINQDFPSVASGVSSKIITYGNHKKYVIRKVREVQIARFTERYMNALQIGIAAFLRIDGHLIDAGTRPVKYLALAAS